jgi:ABC-type transporter Mla MlaB component
MGDSPVSAQQRLEFDVPVAFECEEEESWIRLEGEVGIGSAAELKGLLVQALGTGKQVRVSLQSLTEIDVTAVELLWAARREAKASSLPFVIEGPIPPTITSALLQAGFDEFATDMNAAQAGGGIPCQH